MKKQFLLLAICLLAVCLCQAAWAKGPYMRGAVGGAFLTDSDVSDSSVAPGVTVEFESDAGFAAALAMGYGYNEYFRLELEFAYQSNDLDEVTYGGVNSKFDGETSSMALLINGYLDYANSSPFTPFLTAGIGGAIVDVDDFTVTGTGITTTGGDDTVFAYQVGAGISYQVNARTNVDLTYRYFATADVDLDNTEIEYGSHNVYIGIRMDF